MSLPTGSARLGALLLDWEQLLQAASLNGSLTAAALEALQLPEAPAALNELVQQWSQGDFSALPPIVLLPANDMNGAMGAYALSTGTIYLNQDWLESADDLQAQAVMTEELGHHLDGILNSSDTPGDEGELFAALLNKTPQQDIQAGKIQEQSDAVLIRVDGQYISAEAAIVAPNQIAVNGSGP